MRNGITPVVAVVLLLMMTVVAAGGAYTFITTTTQGAQEEAGRALSTSIAARSIGCGRSVVDLGLSNTGDTTIDTSDVDLYVYRDGDLHATRSGVDLSGYAFGPGGFIRPRLHLPAVLEQGVRYTVEVVFPDASVEGTCEGFGDAGASGVWTFDNEPEHRFIAYQADSSPLAFQYVFDNGTTAAIESFGSDWSTANTDGGIAVADVTGDGAYDIVHGNSGNPDGGQNIYLWRNVGRDPPASPELIASTPSGDGNFQGMTTGDFDTDGRVEIVVVSGCCGTSPTWLINSTATGWDPVELGSSMVARDVVSADFDGDGCEDLVGGSGSGASFWPGRCNGTFGSPTVISSLGSSNYIAEGDFDGD